MNMLHILAGKIFKSEETCKRGARTGSVLRQMESVGVSMLRSARLPWQQAQNESLESRCDESSITLRGTGVCRCNESAPVYLSVCVNGVWVVVGGLSVLRGKCRIINSKSVALLTRTNGSASCNSAILDWVIMRV